MFHDPSHTLSLTHAHTNHTHALLFSTPAAAPAKKAGNPWAKINIADMPVQETGAGVVGQATTTTAATTSSSAAAPTLASMALDALVYTGNQAALTTKAAVLEKSRFIIEVCVCVCVCVYLCAGVPGVIDRFWGACAL